MHQGVKGWIARKITPLDDTPETFVWREEHFDYLRNQGLHHLANFPRNHTVVRLESRRLMRARSFHLGEGPRRSWSGTMPRIRIWHRCTIRPSSTKVCAWSHPNWSRFLLCRCSVRRRTLGIARRRIRWERIWASPHSATISHSSGSRVTRSLLGIDREAPPRMHSLAVEIASDHVRMKRFEEWKESQTNTIMYTPLCTSRTRTKGTGCSLSPHVYSIRGLPNRVSSSLFCSDMYKWKVPGLLAYTFALESCRA
jgi:hypothetical protein